ncbi:protein adenylyltransferase SelO [Natronospora cellulosivora (SeqCode)]
MTEIKESIETGWNLDNSYSHLPTLFFTRVKPTPVPDPKLIIFNDKLAKSLGFDPHALKSEYAVDIFAGNEIPEGGDPLAQAYAGHQFGHFTKLGDGRAILLGEQITPKGNRFDIQLKGSGKTPYSRQGDGRAVLGPMLREYIISEAMYGLGIPTTRSLAVVTTGETIRRESENTGAILTRVAASHLRVGTFEYIAKWGTVDELRTIADYTIERHYPEAKDTVNCYLALLKGVAKRQAELIAKWQLLGFVHGVMNTDNMALSGETIDYGPCAFMDSYDPETVFSSIDRYGRYAYGNQPDIGAWNLARFAETLLPLIDDEQEEAVDLAQGVLAEYKNIYHCNWLEGMRSKLGLSNEKAEDEALIEDLLDLMEKYEADFSNTFIALTFNQLSDMELFESEEFAQWHKRWQARLDSQDGLKQFSYQLMRDSNPALIPRNHRVEEALEAAVEEGDYTVMKRFLDALANPYAHSEEQSEYASLPPSSHYPYRTFCGT